MAPSVQNIFLIVTSLGCLTFAVQNDVRAVFGPKGCLSHVVLGEFLIVWRSSEYGFVTSQLYLMCQYAIYTSFSEAGGCALLKLLK